MPTISLPNLKRTVANLFWCRSVSGDSRRYESRARYRERASAPQNGHGSGLAVLMPADLAR